MQKKRGEGGARPYISEPQRRRLIQDRAEDLRCWRAIAGVYQGEDSLSARLQEGWGGPAAESFLKTASLRTDREASANQEACRAPSPGPHASVSSAHSVLLSEPKLLLFHGVTFQRLLFVL